jgi:glycosyltransferase involved in cell wall biosynthesis
MSAAMRRLAESRQLVEALGRQARTFAEGFTWENAAVQTERHLMRVVGRSGGADLT